MEELVRNGLRNRLLGSLSRAELAALQPMLIPTKLRFRQRLQSSNRTVKAAYFLDSGIASVVAIANGSRSQTEIAVIGCEGVVGLPIILGTGRSPCEVFIQVLRYAHVFTVQAAYTALANAHGKIEERLARWLLMAQDRIASDELLLTHEFLALMLGVRRAGVTVALQHFETRGLITTARGSIVIKDRDGLEEGANGLYGAPEAEFERLFPAA
jgi:hypothetical protein